MIPKIIHQTWRNHKLPVSETLPESWKKHNPDWEYRFWTDADLAHFVEDNYPDMWPLYQAAPKPVQKADIARYLILHKFGGLYADIDTECVGNIDALAAESRVVLSQEPPEHWHHAKLRGMDMIVFNGTMASPAGHPFWLDVMNMLHRCRHAKKSVLDSTGPMMLTGCVLAYARPEELALHSCHLFNPHTKEGTESRAKEFGPLAPLRISTHLWHGTWLNAPNLKSPIARLRSLVQMPQNWVIKQIYNTTRGPFLTQETVAPTLDLPLLQSPLPEVREPENIAILIPVRNAIMHLDRCFALIEKLDYPKNQLKLVFCEGDSDDGSFEHLAELAEKHRPAYRDIVVMQCHTGNKVNARNRWKPALQKHRRGCIAKVRNHLINNGLNTEDDWALWVDVDVCDYAPDTLNQLLAERQKIVAPNCVLQTGGTSYDLNSFLDIGTQRNPTYFRHAHGGLFQPPQNYYWRSHFDDLRYLQRVPLTSVGGTMLLVHSSVHFSGVTFPELPYDDLLETEGFGKMASDFGVVPRGLPNLEIKHVNG